jgi:hypothetical protein
MRKKRPLVDASVQEQERRLVEMPDDNIDFSDIPELDAKFFKTAPLVTWHITSDAEGEKAMTDETVKEEADELFTLSEFLEATRADLERFAKAVRGGGEEYPDTMRLIDWWDQFVTYVER